MRKTFFIGLALLALSLHVCGQSGPRDRGDLRGRDLHHLQDRFTHIPDSVETSVYWYWLSGNISKEGVVKDLEAMKKVGINRAFIGNIGLDEHSKVKMFSDEWWDILHTALKTATRLNIQIGIFNGPGWSQSGGPWIKPEQSMRYLTCSRITVRGPMLLHQKLPHPQPHFQDVKLLAYPVAEGFGSDIGALDPRLSSDPAVDSLEAIMDHNTATGIRLEAGKPFEVTIDTKTPYTVRGVTITTTDQNVVLKGDILAKKEGKYVLVRHFIIDRSNSALNVGFFPFGPAAISIPATTAKSFRVVFTEVSAPSGIAEVELSATPVVENYIEKTLAKMWPTPHPFWDAYQWAPQPLETSKYVVDPARVIDISAFMDSNGVVRWQVPPGNWVIERSGMTPTNVTNSPAPPEGRGLEVDKMSKEHVTAHFNAFLGRILQRIPAEDRKTFTVAVEDSYETGGQNWTDGLVGEFKSKYHYDPTPYIPVLQGAVVGSEDRSDRFLWDLRRLIADNVAFKYVGGLREASHAHGLTTWLENYGHWGFPGEFLQYGGQSDEVGGEFWSEGDLGDIENRAASSSAHIYGKTKVSAESFTAGLNPFGRYPAMFKKRGDRFFTEGINNTLLHVYISQPVDSPAPGLNTWFGVEFNRLNTWFFDMDIFLQYIKRCNLLLQQGEYVADAAYFIGEDAPKMTGVTAPPLPFGYSFDYINGDVIKERLIVRDGQWVLPNGIRYRVLVLPNLSTMRPELLAKIKQGVLAGGVVLGPKPVRSPSLEHYPEADRAVRRMADSLWGPGDGPSLRARPYGKGWIFSGMGLDAVFERLNLIPDVRITGTDSLLFIHRHLADGSLYFISNQRTVPMTFDAAFRVSGLHPSLWNAIDGSVRDLPSYTDNEQTTTVPLELAPYESAFIVFGQRSGASEATHSNYPRTQDSVGVTGPWTVRFDHRMRGPAEAVVFDSLTDWAQNANDSIRYYSGTAYYHTTFMAGSVDPGSHYILDLGLVRAIGKVSVNGIEAGGVWTPPYRVDITRAVRPGNNFLEIKVVNTWVNRLIGDSRLAPGERGTQVPFGPDAHSTLESSGLLGPVVVRRVTY